jgi:hypothetical protein
MEDSSSWIKPGTSCGIGLPKQLCKPKLTTFFHVPKYGISQGRISLGAKTKKARGELATSSSTSTEPRGEAGAPSGNAT